MPVVEVERANLALLRRRKEVAVDHTLVRHSRVIQVFVKTSAFANLYLEALHTANRKVKGGNEMWATCTCPGVGLSASSHRQRC